MSEGALLRGGEIYMQLIINQKVFYCLNLVLFAQPQKKRNENFNDFFFEKFHFGACNLPGAIYIAANREFLAEFCG